MNKFLLFFSFPIMVFSYDLRVNLDAKRPNKGSFYCALFSSPEGFPRDSALALDREIGVRGGEAVQCIFKGLSEGNYAVSVIQDLNNNGRLDLGAFGKPKEPFGISMRKRPRFRVPKFEEAKFYLESDRSISIKVKR